MIKKILLFIATASSLAHAADVNPMHQGLHASGGETTLADGVVAARPEGVYFITADKKAEKGYAEKGDITVTWNKLVTDDKDHPDGPGYLFKPSFTRSYPKSALTIEAVLAREVKAEPRK